MQDRSRVCSRDPKPLSKGGAPFRARRVQPPRCRATAARAPPAPGNAALAAAVEALFQFEPFFRLATRQARAMIVKRGEAIGLDWEGTVADLRRADWDAELAAVTDPTVQTPAYYRAPFHAYPEGNLSWDAALEVGLAAQAVHAPVMDPTGKALDPRGDENLRSSYGECLQRLMRQAGVEAGSIERALDVGCATGLSSLALARAFPAAHVTGVDLSPHFLAVGRHQQRRRQAAAPEGAPPERIALVHAAAEDTRLPAGSFDLVSICLVCHELPAAASEAVFREAHRLLRGGGVLSVMEMNPASAAFRRVLTNPFAYTAFKSTEPYLEQYIGLDMQRAMPAAGFGTPAQLDNTPRHRTVVAVKPM